MGHVGGDSGPYLNCSETTTSSSSTFSTSTPLKKSAPKSKWRSKKKQKIIVDDQTTITIIAESSKKKGSSNGRSNVDGPSLLVADFPDCSKLSPVAKLHVETVSRQQNHQQLQQQNHPQQQLATSNQQQQFQQESQLQQQQQQQLEPQQNSPHHDLSSRKEMIEMLDCEITLDYLLRNGAINIEEFNQLREDEGSAPFYDYHYQDQDGDRDHHHHRRVGGGGGDTDADVLAADEGGETKKNGDDDDDGGDRKDDGKKKKKKGIRDKCSSSSRKRQPESICNSNGNNNNENNKEAQPNKDTADFQLKQLEQHRQQMKRNKKLLEIIETRGLHGRNLFTNALRLTGQHFLANMADDGVRIRALSGSGYLSKSRHKGQVELYMRVKSVQSIDDETFKLVSRMLHKDWISLQDIQSKFSSLRRQQQQQQRNSALLNAQIIDHQQQQNNNKNNKKSFNNKRNNNNKNGDDDDDKGGCFCCCFGRNKMNGADDAVMFEKMKLNNLDDIVIVQQPTTTATTNKNSHGQEAAGLREDHFDHIDGGSVEDLKKVSDSIQRTCQSVYDQFADNHSPLNAMLVRYFEQDRGVLMLETSTCNNKLLIKCICTKLDQVTSIDQDISSNRLATDVEKILTRFLQETAQDDERMTLEFKVAQGSLDEIKVELTN